MLRSSERAAFKRCPQAWWWGVVEGLEILEIKQDALWFGTGVHLALAEYYIPGRVRGRNPIDTWQEYTKDTYSKVKLDVGFDKSEFIDARRLGRDMLEFYLEITDGDPHWEVLAPEQRFQVKIPDPKDPTKAIVLYVGTFDLVIRDLNDGSIKVVDHKTRKAMPSAYELAVLELDDQAGPYITFSTWVLQKRGIIGPNETVRGMEYNFLIKRRKDLRPQNEYGQYLNKNGSVSQVQPADPFLRHYVGRTKAARRRQLSRVQDEALVMAAVRRGDLPILKNPTKDCNWCDFFELCQIDENGGDTDSMKRMAFRKRDPYADHREGAENSKTSLDAKNRTGVS